MERLSDAARGPEPAPPAPRVAPDVRPGAGPGVGPAFARPVIGLAYPRALVKLSGEALAGERGFGFDFEVIEQFADEIKDAVDIGAEIGHDASWRGGPGFPGAARRVLWPGREPRLRFVGRRDRGVVRQ